MIRIALLAALLGAAALPGAAGAADCPTPEGFFNVEGALSHTAAIFKSGGRLRMTVVGGPSTTGKANSSPEMAFPARAAAELERQHPGLEIEVAIEAQTGVVAHRRIESITHRVIPSKPTLVVWQTGTADAVHMSDVDQFSAALGDGIEALQRAGIDIVLMDPQYSPHTASMINFAPYRAQIDQVAQTRHVPLFRRHELMRYWVDGGIFEFGEADKEKMRKEADQAHACIGRLLADLIETRAR